MDKMFVTRGDTIPLAFTRKDTDGHTITDAPDAMYFTLKKGPDVKDSILQKKLSDMSMDQDGKWTLALAPSDTETLPYGSYFFDIEVTASGMVTTIAKGWIVLTEESTWRENKE